MLYRPDRALEWTVHETARNSQNGKPYLLDPFMNEQVSWDSEFYLSIATVGYDDRDVAWVEVGPGRLLSMNYAFYPFYPLVIRIVAAPLKLLNTDADRNLDPGGRDRLFAGHAGGHVRAVRSHSRRA